MVHILGLSCWWRVGGCRILTWGEVIVGNGDFLREMEAATAIGAATATGRTGHASCHHRRIVDGELRHGGGIGIWCTRSAGEGIGLRHDVGDELSVYVAHVVIDRRSIEEEVHAAG